MDYQAEVNGFAPTAHYTYAGQAFDIIVPTRRRSHNRCPSPLRIGPPRRLRWVVS
jgi:hypothetical protein